MPCSSPPKFILSDLIPPWCLNRSLISPHDVGKAPAPLQTSTSVLHSHPVRTEASVCTTAVASTTVCACQASMGAAVSARLGLVSRQGECWALGKLDQNLVVRRGAGWAVEGDTKSQTHTRAPQGKHSTVTAHLGQINLFYFFLLLRCLFLHHR